MRLIKLIICLLLLANPAFAKGGTTSVVASIGGTQVGTVSSSGIYNGYTLVAGDQFDGLLSVMQMDAPFARYTQTHAYNNGARSVGTLLMNSYDSDPYHTGAQDANRGVSVGSNDILVQTSSGLALKARTANGSETPYNAGRIITSGMIMTAPYVTVTAPAIVEASIGTNVNAAGAPLSWHPTFWMQSASPVYTSNPTPGGQEYDFPEIFQNDPEFNFNCHGSCAGSGGNPGGISNTIMGSGNHLFSLNMTAANIKGYIDGTLQGTTSRDGTAPLRPYNILFTNHTFNASAIDLTTWNSLGTSGAVLNVAYYRIWLPNGVAANIVKPTQYLPVAQVAFNTPFTYTIPSLAALWNIPVTSDYCMGLRYEDFEPGGSYNAGSSPPVGTTGYFPFPSELTWNSTTRVLSGSVTSKPGRLHVGCIPYLAGGSVGYTARGYIDVGPNVTTTTIAYSNAAASFDAYFLGDCGTLLPKVLAITGLPAGLSFSPTTGLITGTATTGSYTISYSVTNTVGQNKTQNITLTVGA